jgi:hypothetical protein
MHNTLEKSVITDLISDVTAKACSRQYSQKPMGDCYDANALLFVFFKKSEEFSKSLTGF